MHSFISFTVCLQGLLYCTIQGSKSEHRTTDAKQRWLLIISIYMPLYRWKIKEGLLTFQSPEVKH